MHGIEQLLLVAMFVFGLAFGSFANVVIWRFPRGGSLSHPASHCPKCEHPIRWYDNVPLVSWLVLHGRCRDCGVRISVRYPAVELATGVSWAGCAIAFGLSAATAVAAFMCYMLLILSMIDIDVMRLPNPLVALLGGIGAAAVVASTVTGLEAAPLVRGVPSWNPAIEALAGSAVAGGLSLAIAGAYRGVRGRSGFGMGDVKLLFALGPFLGMYTPGVLFLGSVIGAVWGVAALRADPEGMQAKIPFGPFLALAAVVVLFAGPGLWAWYARLVGLA